MVYIERVRTKLLSKDAINDISQVPTVCGGLIPTSSQYTNLYNNTDIQTEGYKKH